VLGDVTVIDAMGHKYLKLLKSMSEGRESILFRSRKTNSCVNKDEIRWQGVVNRC
jgi:hypothetical protein